MRSIFAIMIQMVPSISLHKDRAVISVIDPQAEQLFPADESVLTLCFGDFQPEDFETDDQPFIKKYRPFLMQPDQADQIVEFLVGKRDKKQLVVQCTGGVARSGAIALFARDLFGIDLAGFRANNRYILPNRHVYRLLHEAARRKGLKVPQTELSLFDETYRS